ncbi:MAG: hypothetical protein COT43_07720 [Candidatus Marinimicrobia bacterium CG08_land_8_20_14_0_20_45_22]|nr:MAG: hypothetical protein COT43_07720 [Candidatus Marinimicrobia bacterium CG08_land_8_20_14_0_20_45_22]
MDYEVKNIGITSVLKITFLTLFTVLSVFSFLFYLIIRWAITTLGNAVEPFPLLGSLDMTDLNLMTLLFASILNGLFITIILLIFILLAIIFYNLYARHVGGIQMTLSGERPILHEGTDEIDE